MTKPAIEPICNRHPLSLVWSQVVPGSGRKVDIYGGSIYTIDTFEGSLALNLSDMRYDPPRLTSAIAPDDIFTRLDAEVTRLRCTQLSLTWQDYAEPPVKAAFWRILLESVETSLLVFCQGGHGRTGTALAALYLTVTKLTTVIDAVQFVRATYCNHAVESLAQLNYLNRLAATLYGPRYAVSYKGRLSLLQMVKPQFNNVNDNENNRVKGFIRG